MQVIAIGNNLRVSPKKAKLLVDQIKKLPPQDAITMLGFVEKGSSPMLKKLIASAVANAKNNNGLDENTLKFKEILIGRGMVFKRFRAVSRGRAHHILKRTSNIKVVLEGNVAKKEEIKKVDEKPEVESKEKAIAILAEEPKTEKMGKKKGSK